QDPLPATGPLPYSTCPPPQPLVARLLWRHRRGRAGLPVQRPAGAEGPAAGGGVRPAAGLHVRARPHHPPAAGHARRLSGLDRALGPPILRQRRAHLDRRQHRRHALRGRDRLTGGSLERKRGEQRMTTAAPAAHFEVHDADVLARARGLLDACNDFESMGAEILAAVERNARWRGEQCINLLAPEAPTSPTVRRLLSAEVGTRAAEGHI